MGGGNLLKSAGTWIGSMGRKAEDIKQTMEQKAVSIEKTVEKKAENVEKAVKTLKEGEKPGEKK
jgi:Sec-independent protein translocase protein TatA